MIAKWLLEGLATTITRQGWYILSSTRHCAATDRNALQRYFGNGYPSLAKHADRPYQIPHPATLYESTSLTRDRYYLRNTARFVQDRKETDMQQELTRVNIASVIAPTTDDESTSRESLTHKLLTKNQKLSCSKHLVSQVSQRPESSRQKTRTLFAAHLSQSDERSPRFTNVLGTFVDMQNHTQNTSTLHKSSQNSWKQLRA